MIMQARRGLVTRYNAGQAKIAPPHATTGLALSTTLTEERMDRSKRTLLVTGIAALLALTGATATFAQQWKPTKPITIIVPWAAGGSTDQVTRVTASEIEKALGQKVIVVNQPGASGSIGTKNTLEAAKDGYTWTAGAAQDLGT